MTNASRYRLGVDVGGTHTDLVLLDTTSGELMVEKVASTPAQSGARRARRRRAIHRPRHRAGGDRLLRPRHHHHHQRAVGDARRQGRAPDHQGLPRGAGDPDPGARRQPVRLFLCQARADRPAEPHPGNPRALRLRRQRHPAARPGGRPASRARAQSRRRRVDRGLLPVLVHEPAPRGGDPRHRSRRNGPACTCRCRARCCRASANGRGSPPPCSTPISSR